MPGTHSIEADQGYRNYVDSFFENAIPLGGGKMLARAASVLSSRAFRRLFQRPGVPEYHERDRINEGFLNHSEEISNTINSHLLGLPDFSEVRRKVEESHDHGIGHIRRIEKWWYKEAFGRDTDLRPRKEVLYFVPCAYLAMRFHDITEVFSGEKEMHDQTSALFALGYLSKLFKAVNETWSIPAEDWDKIVWGTAFLCFHHSDPKEIPSVKDILDKGLFYTTDKKPFDLNEIYDQAAAFLKKRGQTFGEYFPPFALITEELEDMEKGIFRKPPWYKKIEIGDIFDEDLNREVRTRIGPFTGEIFRDFVQEEKEELEALRLQAFIFSACDKLDSNYPAGLSATRTVLSDPTRLFYLDMGHFHKINDEFEARKKDGEGEEGEKTKCDLNRLLYEITRIEDFGNVRGFLGQAIPTTLEEKSKFLQEAIPAFLKGDFSGYMKAYDELEAREIRNMLMKASLSYDEARSVAHNKDFDNRDKEVRVLLTKYDYDPFALDFLLYEITQERETVWLALERKYQKLEGQGEIQGKHIKDLLDLAVKQQKATIRKIPGFSIGLPDYSYYVPNLDEWKLQ